MRRGIWTATPRRGFVKKRGRPDRLANMPPPPPPPPKEVADPFAEDIIVYEYSHAGKMLRVGGLFMGLQSIFFAATVGKILVHPEFGEGFLPVTGACTVFSVFVMVGINMAARRHLSKITLEKGGTTVRLGSLNLLHELVETQHDISDINLAQVERNTRGENRYLQVGDSVGYHIFDERGVLEEDALEYIFTTTGEDAE